MNRANRKTVNQEFERFLAEVTQNSSPESTENNKIKQQEKTQNTKKKRNEKRKKLVQKKKIQTPRTKEIVRMKK